MNYLPMLSLIAAALLATGCVTAPALQQPAVDTPAAFAEKVEIPASQQHLWKVAQPQSDKDRGRWWRIFDDATLDQLQADLAASNPGLQAAAARVRQARGTVGDVRSDQALKVNVGFNGERKRTSLNSPTRGEGQALQTTTWRAPLTFDYEVDLWGKLSQAVSQSEAQLRGAEAAERSVALALQAELATTYFSLRETVGEYAVVEATLRLREDALRFVERRFAAGDVSELDVARARTELAAAKSEAVTLADRRTRLEHAIAILVGKAPASFRVAAKPFATSERLPLVPQGVPSALLERRPDIAEAQHAMAAANLRIGVVKAAFFPTIRLGGSAGFEAGDLADLFKWGSRTWALGPLAGLLVAQPILEGGKSKANLAIAEARFDETAADYRARVLTAFGEVEGSLAGLRYNGQQGDIAEESRRAAARAAEIAAARYNAGASSQLELIDANRNLLAAERMVVQVQGARATGTVALVRALGGGWGETVN